VQAILDSHPELAVAHEAQFVVGLGRRSRRYERRGSLDGAQLVEDLFATPNAGSLGLTPGEAVAALDAAGARSFADATRAIFAAYAAQRGKARYGDKTPGYVTSMPLIASMLPEARFVHVIRDGRDSALSYRDHDYGPRTLEAAAFRWASRVRRGRRAGLALGPERYVELRYEELLAEPEAALRPVCDLFELSWDDRMLHHHERADELVAATKDPERFQNLRQPITAGLRDWRRDMTPAELEVFDAIAGDTLADLGYERTGHRGRRSRAVSGPWVRWQQRRLRSALHRTRRRVR
jgi:hypothetical protein